MILISKCFVNQSLHCKIENIYNFLLFRVFRKVPRMPTTTEFLNSSTPEEFKALLTVYHDALQIKAMLKNKKQGESLESLDKLV